MRLVSITLNPSLIIWKYLLASLYVVDMCYHLYMQLLMLVTWYSGPKKWTSTNNNNNTHLIPNRWGYGLETDLTSQKYMHKVTAHRKFCHWNSSSPIPPKIEESRNVMLWHQPCEETENKFLYQQSWLWGMLGVNVSHLWCRWSK